MTLHIKAEIQTFPILGHFAISRETRTQQIVIHLTLQEDRITAQGECVPYKRYHETPEGVLASIQALIPALQAGMTRQQLQDALPAGAARNAIDCALWDFEAKKRGITVAELAGLTTPHALTTAYTLSLGAADEMAQAAQKAAERPLLKVKLGGDGDPERILAVRRAAPKARLVVDANEAWTPQLYPACIKACQDAGVEMIEQPFPADQDDILADLPRPIAICADESLHESKDLAALRNRYDAINIKLDKAGGLTHALDLLKTARALDFKIMVGCMLATSLAMAPAILLAQTADVVDLDGPLLLERDREPILRYEGSVVHPALTSLWG